MIGASAENRTVMRSAKSSVARARAEDAEERTDRPVPRRHGCEHLGQGRAARPPELVRVRVDHPIARRTRVAARRAMRVTHSSWRRSSPGSRIRWTCPDRAYSLEHLGRAVLRAVVGRDHDVGAGVQVEREPRFDDVDLVPREQRHDERHRRASLRAIRPALRSSALEASLERATRAARRGRCRRSRRARRLGGVGRVLGRALGRGNASRRPSPGSDERPVVARSRAKCVPEAGVDAECPVREPLCERRVVDRERVVVVGDAALRTRLVEQRLMAAWRS